LHTATDIPNIEPTEIIKGSTVKWNKSLSHYSATDGWTLTYAIRGVSVLDITAIANGADHSIVLSATQTAALYEGDHWWQSYATKGAERFDVGSGQINVKNDLAFIQAGQYDGRSHVKKVLDAIEATLEGRASTADLKVQINGRSVEHWTPEQLVFLHDKYRGHYAQEINANRISNGMRTKSKVYTRFTSV